MKKAVLGLLTVFVIALLASCSKTVTGPATQTTVVENDLSVPWLAQYFATFPIKKIKDSISFYNSTEITLVGTFTNQSVSFQDGAVYVVDSVNQVSKVVPKMTPGKMVNIAVNNTGVNVSYSRNEATYTFTFAKQLNGSYLLDKTNASLFFHGKKYKATAIASSDCIIKFYITQKQEKIETKEQAEGIKP